MVVLSVLCMWLRRKLSDLGLTNMITSASHGMVTKHRIVLAWHTPHTYSCRCKSPAYPILVLLLPTDSSRSCSNIQDISNTSTNRSEILRDNSPRSAWKTPQALVAGALLSALVTKAK